MRVNMNKTKVVISGERQKVDRRLQDGHVGSAVKVLVAIHYSVIVARNEYIACRKWQSHLFAVAV